MDVKLEQTSWQRISHLDMKNISGRQLTNPAANPQENQGDRRLVMLLDHTDGQQQERPYVVTEDKE